MHLFINSGFSISTMDKLKSMQVFIDIVEKGSLIKAAERHQISATMVGKHLKALEKELSTSLINRTTRKLSLTEAGNLYYQSCKQIQQTLLSTENQLQQLQHKPSGSIKINAPLTFSEQVLAPLLPQFLKQHPDIQLNIMCDNQLVDPLQVDADIFIRIGELENSNLYAQYLGEYQLIYAASPSYLNQYTAPTNLQELTQHRCLGFLFNQSHPQQINTDYMPVQSNSGQLLQQTAIAGCGIILQPKMLLESALASGQLIQLLHNDCPPAKPIHAIYKHKPLPLKCKVFIDFVKANDSYEVIDT